MAKTSAIVTYTDQDGKTCQKALSDINPDASNAEIKTFAQKLIGLTDNVYVGTDRVDKVNCDTEASKQTPTITLPQDTITLNTLRSELTNADMHLLMKSFTYTGDGVPYAYIQGCWAYIGVAVYPGQTAGSASLNITTIDTSHGAFQGINEGGTITVCLPETDNYKAAQAVITITV